MKKPLTAESLKRDMTRQKNPRTKTRVFIRHGNNDPKETIARPRDWSARTKSEGRTGKASRAKKVKLKETLMPVTNLVNIMAMHKIGLPECKWMVTCNNPARQLTPHDILRINHDAWSDRMREPEEKRLILVRYNDAHRVLEIDDLTDILPSTEDIEKQIATIAKP